MISISEFKFKTLKFWIIRNKFHNDKETHLIHQFLYICCMFYILVTAEKNDRSLPV